MSSGCRSPILFNHRSIRAHGCCFCFRCNVTVSGVLWPFGSPCERLRNCSLTTSADGPPPKGRALSAAGRAAEINSCRSCSRASAKNLCRRSIAASGSNHKALRLRLPQNARLFVLSHWPAEPQNPSPRWQLSRQPLACRQTPSQPLDPLVVFHHNPESPPPRLTFSDDLHNSQVSILPSWLSPIFLPPRLCQFHCPRSIPLAFFLQPFFLRPRRRWWTRSSTSFNEHSWPFDLPFTPAALQ